MNDETRRELSRLVESELDRVHARAVIEKRVQDYLASHGLHGGDVLSDYVNRLADTLEKASASEQRQAHREQPA